MMMMTSAQIRDPGEGVHSCSAPGVPRFSCSCGAAVRRAIQTVLPQGLADKHQCYGMGGRWCGCF